MINKNKLIELFVDVKLFFYKIAIYNGKSGNKQVNQDFKIFNFFGGEKFISALYFFKKC